MGTKARSMIDTWFAAMVFAAAAQSTALAGEGAAKAASGSDWPNLFGPTHDSVSTEPGVNLDWPEAGPKIHWKVEVGTGYSPPVVSGGLLALFHRVENEEVIEGLDAETGKSQWSYRYPTRYVDRYGYNNGPRGAPIMDGERVYAYGAEGRLHCLKQATGKIVWQAWPNNDYEVEQGFFGAGSTPLLEGDVLIINVGGKTKEAGIVGFDKLTGKPRWKATTDGAGYSTPTPATIHGKRYVFVFTEAGLVSLDPTSGKVHWSIPFRSKLYESVNSAPPVVVGDIVFVSATYGTGALSLRIKPDGSYEELWRDRRAMESHFSNYIVEKDCIIGYSGRHENTCNLRCVELLTGKVRWSRDSILGRGSSLKIGDRLLLWGERGHLVVTDTSLDEPKVLNLTGESLLDGPCWAPPALCHGRLYLRNEGTLLCLDLSPPAK